MPSWSWQASSLPVLTPRQRQPGERLWRQGWSGSAAGPAVWGKSCHCNIPAPMHQSTNGSPSQQSTTDFLQTKTSSSSCPLILLSSDLGGHPTTHARTCTLYIHTKIPWDEEEAHLYPSPAIKCGVPCMRERERERERERAIKWVRLDQWVLAYFIGFL